MRTNRFRRLLGRVPLLLPLLLAACASSGGSGPSEDRTLDILAIAGGCAVLIVIGVLMYIDNED